MYISNDIPLAVEDFCVTVWKRPVFCRLNNFTEILYGENQWAVFISLEG